MSFSIQLNDRTSFDTLNANTLTVNGTMSSDNLSLRTNKRIYQELNSGSSYNAVNGYLGLAKDAYPAVSSAYAEKAVSTWTARTYSPSSDVYWLCVCWSPELRLFVAVSYSGKIMTSSDGINWSSISSPSGSWISVCWSAELSLFVAVAYDGDNRVMTSSNGTQWVTRNASVNNNWSSICWSRELRLFVAVSNSGTNNRVMTSPDGINWTTRTSPVNNNWRCVCWAPELGLFVAVADSGTDNRVMTSPDGINWTIRSTVDKNGSWRSVCWSAELGLFVAVAFRFIGPLPNNLVMTSPDGINWTTRSCPNNNWWSVCWSAELGLFMAIANNIDNLGTVRLMSSTDGINWTLRTPTTDTEWWSICWSPELGIFVGVGYNAITTSSLAGRPPTSYNVFDSPFNSIDSTGNWTIQQVLKSIVIDSNTATPSALGANLLYINNTGPTSITNFTGGSSGQMLTLVFGNGNTTVQSTGTIKLSGGGNFAGTADDTLTLINNGAKWLEISRSIN